VAYRAHAGRTRASAYNPFPNSDTQYIDWAAATRRRQNGATRPSSTATDASRPSAAAASRFWSRRGNGFTDRFPQIVRACEKLPPDTLIDGEVIVLDENGRCTFNALHDSVALPANRIRKLLSRYEIPGKSAKCA